MAGRLELHVGALRQAGGDVPADRLGRDRVVGALHHEAGRAHGGEVAAVVGQEGHAGEPLGDVGSLRQKLLVSSSPSSGRSSLPMITGAIALDQPR